ncbi:MAG: S41 family peptidase [Acidobacteriota bacterium]|nr:S41 family peptidase [Acidobacteriota bacterium]MDH3785847.1 S41 family peptidase [Acidobacteriota bacterium]
MRPGRVTLLSVSTLLTLVLVGGGFFLQVGAGESSYRQAVLFAEVLSLVMENYVDPLDSDEALRGAYEGMLSGLDPQGAFLSAEEVEAWKATTMGDADPGFTLLKSGRSMQVVALRAESAAAEAGIELGDQLRSIDGLPVRNLSLAQARRALSGESGTDVVVEIVDPGEGFQRNELVLQRRIPSEPAYRVEVVEGIAVLEIDDLSRIDMKQLADELGNVGSRGVSELLVDLRNVAEDVTRDVAVVGRWFGKKTLLRLREPSGRQLETVQGTRGPAIWEGRVAVLVNSATAGAAEAFTVLLRDYAEATVYGEKTYGLGSEARLFELESGVGLLVSAAVWETEAGSRWYESGVRPDVEVSGEGENYIGIQGDQLQQVLNRIKEDANADDPPA